MIGFEGAFLVPGWGWWLLALAAFLGRWFCRRRELWAWEWVATVAVVACTIVGVWVWRAPNPRTWHALVVAVVVVAAALAPRRRRLLVVVPVTVALLMTIHFIDRGRDELRAERPEVTAAASYGKACGLANRFAGLGLADAARRQLEVATTGKPVLSAVHIQCRLAATRLTQLDPTFNATSTPAPAAAAASSADVSMVVAFQTGVERTLAPLLRPHDLEGEDRAPLAWGPQGWLALGAAALFVLLLWTRIYSWFHRRASRPTVDLEDPAAADDDDKKHAAVLGAELRVDLFDSDLRQSTTPTTMTDAAAGLVESSEVTGAKLVAALMRVLSQLFATGDSIKVKVSFLEPTRIVLCSQGTAERAQDIHPVTDPDHVRLRRLAGNRIRWVALTRAGTVRPALYLHIPEDAMYHLTVADAQELGS